MIKQIRNAAYFISTLGFIGTLPYARLWGGLLGLPVLFLAKLSYNFAPGLFWLVIGLGFFFLAGTVFYTRTFASEKEEEFIILDRALGVMISLAFLPTFSLKFLTFGVMLFYALTFVSTLLQRLYGDNKEKFDFMMLMTTGEILLIAVVTNIVLRFLWWVTH